MTTPATRAWTTAILVAATLVLTSCAEVAQYAHGPMTPARSAASSVAAVPQATSAALKAREAAGGEQALIVIPKDWRTRAPFAERFPVISSSDGTTPHVIDLAAMRFRTDDLVTTSAAGQRFYAMPNLSTFPQQLDRQAFAVSTDDYFIVQAKTAGDQAALRRWLEGEGIPIIDYLPELAYLVRISPKQLGDLEQRPEVFWTGHYSPAFRVDPLLDFIIQANPSQHVELQVVFDAGLQKEIQPLLDRIKDLGLANARSARRSRDWTIRADAAALTARDVMLLPGALWVERYVPPELANNVARTSQSVVTGRGASSGPIMDVEDVWNRGIRGEGQIVSEADTGLSTGVLTTLHQDFGQSGSATNPLRVIAAYALGRTGDWSDNQAIGGGHGTHTSGSLTGNGVRSGSSPSTNSFPPTSYAGTAPKAQLVFQSVMDASGGLGGIPLDLNVLFQQTYNDGARVHSNSWGSNAAGQYTTDSQAVDEFAWLNKDMVITFSAANTGTDATTTDGIINPDSMGSPATAKNCISIGASENYRPDFVYEHPAGDCTSLDGAEQRTWGWFNASRFPVPPLYSDLIADNANGMAPFSARGPTDDGRFKPDLVAPGTAVISTRTEVSQAYEDWGTCPVPLENRPFYFAQGGTSMANPLAAGTAALVRQYYADGWHRNHTAVVSPAPVVADGFNPSSALVKATLINGAWDMSPGQYGTGGTREIVAGWDSGVTLPNNVEGFGRVDLEKALFPGSGWMDSAGRKLMVHDVTAGLTTGSSNFYSFDVGGSGDPLIVTLVWTDPEGATGAGVKLVNNLDLVVVAPGGGTRYFPNGVDKTSGADTLNNVEQVKVSSPEMGVWSVTVAGTNVPGNAEQNSNVQPYALVISGQACTSAPSVPQNVTATASGPNRVTVSWSASTGSPTGYKVYRSAFGGSCQATGYVQIGGTTGGTTTTYDDIGVSGGGTYSYRVVAVGSSCASASSSCVSVVTTGACTRPPSFAGLTTLDVTGQASCKLDLSWSAAQPSCAGDITYSIYRSTTSGFVPTPSERIAAGVTGTAYTDVNVTSGTTYYYVVRAAEFGIEDTNTVEHSGSPVGPTVVLYSQNFDSLPAGDMAGFTVTGTGTTADWRGVMACAPAQSGSNILRFGGADCTSNYANSDALEAVLAGTTGVAIPPGATNLQLSFWHRWTFESNYDGGYLRIRRQGDTTTTAVPATAILLNPYTGSALGQAVWTGGHNSALVNSIVDLDAACNAIPGNSGGCAGQTIFISFTAKTDSSVTYVGWFIDDVEISYHSNSCSTCTRPGLTSGLVLTTPAANTVHLSWVGGTPTAASYNIYRERGSCPVSAPVRIAAGVTGTTYDDTGLAGGTAYRYVVRGVSATGCESSNSPCQSVTATGAAFPGPPALLATAADAQSVIVTWGPVDGASAYRVERSVDHLTFTPFAVTPGTVIPDASRSPNTSYLYRAYALSGSSTSAASNRDLATTVMFTDSPLAVGDLIRTTHVTQLRTAVNAVRVLAGLGAASYTDPTLTPGSSSIDALHITELRTNLAAARTILAVPAISFTDPTVTAQTTKVKAVHIDQLRSGTQ